MERLRNALRQTSGKGVALTDASAPMAPLQGGPEPLDPGPYRQRFLKAMDSDLNAPQALAALFDLSKEINRAAESGGDVSQAQETLRYLGDILGLTFRQPQRDMSAGVKPLVELLVELRGELRGKKEYALADKIRQRLEQLGVQLEDTPQGTLWRDG